MNRNRVIASIAGLAIGLIGVAATAAPAQARSAAPADSPWACVVQVQIGLDGTPITVQVCPGDSPWG